VITELARTNLVSAEVGIVHRLDDGVTSFAHPRLSPAYAQTCDTRQIFDVAHTPRAGGLAPDLPAARAAALGESVERYSACHLPRSRLRELAGGDVEPDWLDASADHAPTQYVPGWRLSPQGTSTAWIGASRVYLSSVDPLDVIALPTSSGLACHPDPWVALRSALLEVIERDAVMVTWLTRAVTRPIRSELRWRSASGRVVRFDRAVEDYRLYLLSSPVGIPVVFGVAYGTTGQPSAAVGAAADIDLARACRRALVEAAQTFHYATMLLAQGRYVPACAAEIMDLDDHVAYYLPAARRSAFDFLDAQCGKPIDVDLDDRVAPERPEADVRAVIAAADRSALACYAVDATAPDVRESGLWVIRAVIPDLFPLVVGPQRHLRHCRLSAAASLNPDPHPFP
jgi:ribosomal protein S12 methylthiotransferase accessory factor